MPATSGVAALVPPTNAIVWPDDGPQPCTLLEQMIT